MKKPPYKTANCLVGSTEGNNTVRTLEELFGPRPRRVTQVKTFTSAWLGNLEALINGWLAERGPTFHLLDINYSSTDTKTGTVYSAMAVYTDLETEEDEKEAER